MISLSGEESLAEVVMLRRELSRGQPREQILLTRDALIRILRRHASGELGSLDLVEMANLLEAHEDVDYEAGVEAPIAEVLFELSSPEINGELSSERDWTLIHQLENVSRDLTP